MERSLNMGYLPQEGLRRYMQFVNPITNLDPTNLTYIHELLWLSQDDKELINISM